MANTALHWIDAHVMPWLFLGGFILVGLMFVGLIAAWVYSVFFDKSAPQIVLNSSEWECARSGTKNGARLRC
jgi:hypothetical protein